MLSRSHGTKGDILAQNGLAPPRFPRPDSRPLPLPVGLDPPLDMGPTLCLPRARGAKPLALPSRLHGRPQRLLHGTEPLEQTRGAEGGATGGIGPGLQGLGR